MTISLLALILMVIAAIIVIHAAVTDSENALDWITFSAILIVIGWVLLF